MWFRGNVNTTNTALLVPGRVFYRRGCAAKVPRHGAGRGEPEWWSGVAQELGNVGPISHLYWSITFRPVPPPLCPSHVCAASEAAYTCGFVDNRWCLCI